MDITARILRAPFQGIFRNMSTEIEEWMLHQLTSSFSLRWNPREHVPGKRQENFPFRVIKRWNCILRFSTWYEFLVKEFP